MRKILKLITPLLTMLVLLTACSSEKTKVYTKSEDKMELQVTIYYKGDTVNKMITVNSLSDVGDDINSEVESLKKYLKKILTISLDILIQLKGKMEKSLLLGRQILLN